MVSSDRGPPKALVTKGSKGFQKGKTLTFMDSGASDTMFILKDSFVRYKPVSRTGESAKATGGDLENHWGRGCYSALLS